MKKETPIEFKLMSLLDSYLVRNKSCAVGRYLENLPKNRYTDILPYDETLVSLNVPNESVPIDTYINASYIEPKLNMIPDCKWEEINFSNFDSTMPRFNLFELNKRSRHYIATQAPLKNTLASFVQLSVELAMNNKDRTCNILMLTEVQEKHRVKSLDYVAAIDKEIYKVLNHRMSIKINEEDIIVKKVRKIDEFIELVKFKFIINGIEYVVKHFHLRHWKDYSPPIQEFGHDPLIVLIKYLSKHKGEILAHCSAGVGRTGTYIALDYYYNECLSKRDKLIEIICSLKCCRMLMVQNLGQFKYLRKAVVELEDGEEDK